MICKMVCVEITWIEHQTWLKNDNGANNTWDKSYTYIQGIQICNWVKEQRPKVIECWQYISSLISCCSKVQNYMSIKRIINIHDSKYL